MASASLIPGKEIDVDSVTTLDVYTSVAGTFVYPLAYPYDISTMTVTLAGVGQALGDDQQGSPT
jgi:hypothetical protein